MTCPTETAPDAATTPKKARTRRKGGPRIDGGSQTARQRGAVILEVLGGMLRPSQAAKVLEVSVPRYYTLEKRALEGLLHACEPQDPGRKAGDPAKETEKLRKDVKRLEQECARYRALARASQHAVGLSSAKMSPPPGKRKPTVRALRAARSLREESPSGQEESHP